jgi:hypothetical protein
MAPRLRQSLPGRFPANADQAITVRLLQAGVCQMAAGASIAADSNRKKR